MRFKHWPFVNEAAHRVVFLRVSWTPPVLSGILTRGAQMIRKFFLALCVTAYLAGCASAPSQNAARVKEADQNMVAGCELIGTIIGSSLIGGVVTTGGNNAMVDAKEQAASQGATHIVFMSVDSGSQYSTGKATARAYKCAATRQ